MLLKQEYLGKNGEIIKNTTDEELQNRIEQLSIQDKFNKSMEKLQDIIGSIVQGPLGTFVGFIGKILESTTILSMLLGTIATVQLVNMSKALGMSLISLAGMIPKAATLLGLDIGRAAANIASANALTLGLGAIGIMAGIVATMLLLKKFTTPQKPQIAGDIISPAKGKTMVSTKEGGLFELSPNDDLVAAPGISNKIGKSKESTSIMSSSINIQPLIDEMAAVRTILTSILNKEGNVSIDGNLVGKTLALAEYRTGS